MHRLKYAGKISDLLGETDKPPDFQSGNFGIIPRAGYAQWDMEFSMGSCRTDQLYGYLWACSSSGRALHLQCRARGFDYLRVHYSLPQCNMQTYETNSDRSIREGIDCSMTLRQSLRSLGTVATAPVLQAGNPRFESEREYGQVPSLFAVLA